MGVGGFRIYKGKVTQPVCANVAWWSDQKKGGEKKEEREAEERWCRVTTQPPKAEL